LKEFVKNNKHSAMLFRGVIQLLLLFTILFTSCINQPEEPAQEIFTNAQTGALILSEGLWGMDNSSLSRYDFATENVIKDYFKLTNPGFHLGDIANSMILRNDTAYIAVTTAKTVFSISVSSGKLLNSMILTGNHAPRKLCIFDDENAFVSDLYSNSVIQFNPKTMKEIREIPVGPAPEGMCMNGIYLFVANSGYGDYLADRPKAGTVSVIDVLSGLEIQNFIAGPNVVDVKINKKTNSLFAIYNNLPSRKNETGGIIEFNLTDLTLRRKWVTPALSVCFAPGGDTLFFLNKFGVALIDLKNSADSIRQLIVNPNKNDIWYSLSYYYPNNSLWVGNAKNYQVNGEVLIYNLRFPETFYKKFDVGVNPNTIVFY